MKSWRKILRIPQELVKFTKRKLWKLLLKVWMNNYIIHKSIWLSFQRNSGQLMKKKMTRKLLKYFQTLLIRFISHLTIRNEIENSFCCQIKVFVKLNLHLITENSFSTQLQFKLIWSQSLMKKDMEKIDSQLMKLKNFQSFLESKLNREWNIG